MQSLLGLKSAQQQHYVRVRYGDRDMQLPACAPKGKHFEGRPELCTLEAFMDIAKSLQHPKGVVGGAVRSRSRTQVFQVDLRFANQHFLVAASPASFFLVFLPRIHQYARSIPVFSRKVIMSPLFSLTLTLSRSSQPAGASSDMASTGGDIACILITVLQRVS